MAETTQPAVIGIAIASGILGSVVGYFIGQGSSIGLFGTSSSPEKAKGSKVKKSWPNSYDVTIHPDSSDEELQAQLRSQADVDDEDEDEESDEEDEGEGTGAELKSFNNSSEEVKMVLAVRTDLGMTKGKIAAQCGHATLACYKYLASHAPSASVLRAWELGGQKKVAVKVDSEEELTLLQAQAVSLGLCARLIHDAGRTQIAAGSATVLGVLGPKSVVDQVTGQLKLL